LAEKEKRIFAPTWHGIPREEIDWYPTVESELCVGCGRRVYKFDYENNVPVVANPLNCLVGCRTCANTCPQHAISFPPMSYLHKLIRKRGVISRNRKTLMSNIEKYAYKKEG